MHRVIPWYLPSFYGDIRLETMSEGKTAVLYEALSPSECLAMKTLRKRAMGGLGRQRWCLPQEFREEFGSDSAGSVVLRATIEEVQAVLAKALKPGRSLLTAVRFSDGTVEEKKAELASYRVNAKPLDDEKEPEKKDKPEETKPADLAKKEPTAATTVAAPERGCPLPAFERAEIKATRVLHAFLTPEQADDFRRTQQFVATGADTGHRYLLTSRHSTAPGARTVHDLDENIPYCVHDWTVPAAEELLALALFLGLPGRESYLRDIPDDGTHGVVG